ncbi:MAG: hypothetical protein JWP51_3152 [Bradyrhizobium sp.]|nr:hypothetical protein [Bradyrhizobium sp.]
MNKLNNETRELTIEELDAASGGLDFPGSQRTWQFQACRFSAAPKRSTT